MKHRRNHGARRERKRDAEGDLPTALDETKRQPRFIGRLRLGQKAGRG
jgi:hypothetical protein